MTAVRFVALDTDIVRALQDGEMDANGQPPERHISDDSTNLCRHCLAEVAIGTPMLIFAHRPFPKPQPYAEIGPIFLHAEYCRRYGHERDTPALFFSRSRLLLRGYGADDRIIYGTGTTVPPDEIEKTALELFAPDHIAYIHVRSATNNCYQCRIEPI